MKILAMFGLLALLGGTAMDLREVQVPAAEDYVLFIEEKAEEREEETIRLQTGSNIMEMPLEEYLVGVVLTEMPASFQLEALKAQTVAARTYAMRTDKHEGFDLCSDSGCCQAWRSEGQLRQAFGADYDAYMGKGQTAVRQTEGEVLCYGEELIEAVYFSCSGGMSEPAVAVWGTEVPYLQAVESPGEEASSKFFSEVRLPFREFRDIVETAAPNAHLSVIPQDWIGEIQYSAGGGVASMELGGVAFTGTEIRSLFSLASTRFQLKIEGGEMVFSVQGYGHRVGMSQYGANAMAAGGADHAEILTHYYTGVSIKKLSRT